jgi:hypothetical protein
VRELLSSVRALTDFFEMNRKIFLKNLPAAIPLRLHAINDNNEETDQAIFPKGRCLTVLIKHSKAFPSTGRLFYLTSKRKKIK